MKVKRERGVGTLAVTLMAGLGCTACDRGMSSQASPLDERGPPRTLPQEPMFSVSGVEFEGDSIFLFGIRSASFLSDGSLAIGLVSRGDARVAVVDEVGSAVGVIGRRGEGPGELRSISGVFELGGAVAVADGRNRRVTFFERDGSVGREVGVPLPAGDRIVGMLSDGSIMIDRPVEVPDGPDVRAFERWSASEERSRALVSVPQPADSPIRIRFTRYGREVSARLGLPRDCWPVLFRGVLGDMLVFADPSTGRVWSVAASGEARVIHTADHRPTLTEEALAFTEDYIHDRTRGLGRPEVAPDGRRVSADVQVPSEASDTIVAMMGEVGDPSPVLWSAMVLDPSGWVWLREAHCTPEKEASVWLGVEVGGPGLTRLELPPDHELMAARGARVLVRSWDQFDVETLSVYDGVRQ